MTWPDLLVVFAALLIAGGSWLARRCFRKAMEHYPSCSCGDCVDAALAMVEHDTEKVGAAK